jgi:hypothetical protein
VIEVSGKFTVSNGEIMMSREARRISVQAWCNITASNMEPPTGTGCVLLPEVGNERHNTLCFQ